MIPKSEQVRRAAFIIMDASSLIRLRGFCIGALNDDSGRLCLMGAIRECAKYEPRVVKYTAYDAVNKELRRPIHEWNDEQTEAGRVADLLETVARRIMPGLTPRIVCRHGQAQTLDSYACGECKAEQNS